MRLIINGKKAQQPEIREAVETIRSEGTALEVRVTYEYGDIARFVQEAVADEVKRLIVGGGDGTINEIVNALLKIPESMRPELAILPLGTANDLATSCHIPKEPLDSLELAIKGQCYAIDAVQANDRYFINVATAGFGAEVTANTPTELKNFLGGGAYTITGVLKAVHFVPYHGKIWTEHVEVEGDSVVAAVCNGRQAGGGQVLAPHAYLDDGLLDVIFIQDFELTDIPQVLLELANLGSEGTFVKYFKTPWVECETQEQMPTNLDGEPYSSRHIRFEIIPKAIKLVMPMTTPLLEGQDI